MSPRSLTVSCSCGAATHTFRVPSSSLPLPAHLCSCNISRRISGALLTSYINITHPSAANPHPGRPDTSTCTAYASSEILTRWFCATCGTHMYLEYCADGHFEAATGTLVLEGGEGKGRGSGKGSDELVRFKSCMWVPDTKDGGASVWVRQIDGKDLPRWSEEAGHSSHAGPLEKTTRPAIEVEDNSTAAEREKRAVHAHCHCRGVEFWLTPPNAASTDAASPFPDLMVPHYLDQSANPDNVPWWLSSSGGKYLAGTCTCHSCRRASGFDITFWAFVPTANIVLSPPSQPASPIPFPPSTTGFPTWGTMRTYASSPGVTRTFCSRCGANVFWAGDEERFGRRGLVDVAVGLLDAGSGARAEEVLAWWTGRVSFAEDAVHRGLVAGLERGLEEWAEKVKG